ncbi:MAG: FAD-dependent oxidoreductase, partial [Gammaproteobacteria bacterium]|nr:FAD-dependent oxidoreductase [Gammaproteobacteria bacterium]
MNDTFTFRRYRDGDSTHVPWPQDVVVAGESAQCPVYLHRTPPCQGGCPAGEDIRGWLGIVRGLELPPAGTSPQAYAFQRATDANPFPAIMGRVCPAPCEDGCNRNHLDDRVGINAVEQFIGDWALGQRARLERPAPETGRHVAIVGGGVAGLACAYQLRRKGHACTIFDERTELGGMARYGIPGYRIPRAVMDGEFERILDTGVEARMGIRVGRDIPIETIEREFDAVLLAIGAQSGQRLPYPGGDAPNCVSGIAFLQAFNEGRLKIAAHRVVVIGGGDTAIDVVSVARRLGHVRSVSPKDRPENVLLGHTAHDVATAARREGAEVRLVYRRPIEKMRAARHEVEAALREGVEIQGSLAPVEVVLGADGRARALRVVPVEWTDEGMVVQEGAEFDIPCDLVVAAIGQAGDFTGIEAFDNGKGQVDADAHFQVPDRPGYFVAGDAVRPHLLTTAVGQ